MDDPFVLLGVLFGITFVAALIIFIRAKYLDSEYYENKLRKRVDKSSEETYGGGRWSFPAQELYESCRKNEIASLSSAYEKSKAKALADEILRKIPEKYRSLYNSDKQIEEYFHSGKELWEAEQERKAADDRAYKSASHNAVLTEQQKETMSFYVSLAKEDGAGKRKAMLKKLRDTFNEKIRHIENAKKSMQELGFILAQSASQQKTVDTAVAAGLANGIGGAGAALYATADAMSRNARTEAENRRNREAVNQLAVGMYNNSFALSDDIDSLRKQREPYDKALEELRTKVVIEGPDTQELFKSLKIETPTVEKLESGALSVKTTLKTSYRPDVPKNVKTTVDGTLTGKVYAGDLYVGECVLPLPLYGVECGNPAPTQAETICGRFAANDQPYRVEFTPNKLWVMEL